MPRRSEFGALASGIKGRSSISNRRSEVEKGSGEKEGISMSRKIKLTFSGFDKTISATLTQDSPPVADALWDALEKPLKLYTWHTISTGDYFIGKGRGPLEPVRVGSQAKPIGETLLLCRLKPGSICYGGAEEISFSYGPNITEPLPDKGPVTAMVDEASLEDFYQAGMHIWTSQTRKHQLVTVTVRRA
jgi:hypothetical protein